MLCVFACLMLYCWCLYSVFELVTWGEDFERKIGFPVHRTLVHLMAGLVFVKCFSGMPRRFSKGWIRFFWLIPAAMVGLYVFLAKFLGQFFSADERMADYELVCSLAGLLLLFCALREICVEKNKE